MPQYRVFYRDPNDDPRDDRGECSLVIEADNQDEAVGSVVRALRETQRIEIHVTGTELAVAEIDCSEIERRFYRAFTR